AAQPQVVINETVMHKQPTTTTEGGAVGLLNRRPRGRANVSQEDRRFDLLRELSQVAVTPSRLDAAVQPGDVPVAVPAQTEPIRVGITTSQAVSAALLNERMLRLIEQYLGPNWISEVRDPTAHPCTVSDREPAGGKQDAGADAELWPPRSRRMPEAPLLQSSGGSLGGRRRCLT